MPLRSARLSPVVAACIALALTVPSAASAECLSTTPNAWTVSDPIDQVSGGPTDVTALHITIDSACRLSMWIDISGALDPNANLVMYDMDTDGVPGVDRSVQLQFIKPDRPNAEIWLGTGNGGGIGYQPVPGFTLVGDTGWSATLDTLAIGRPGPMTVNANVWELMPLGSADTVPDNYARFPFDLVGFTTADKPVATALPAVVGDPEAGHVLSCAEGSWTGVTTSVILQWLRDGSAIEHATEATYTTSAADVGHLVACQVTRAGPAGSASATSAGLMIVDETAPRIERLTIVPRRFRTASSGAVIRAAAAAGARVRYALSESATVTMTVQRRALKARRFKTLKGAVHLPGKAGDNSFRFTGRWSHTSLAPGSYRLTLAARDAAGNTSRGVTTSFRVL